MTVPESAPANGKDEGGTGSLTAPPSPYSESNQDQITITKVVPEALDATWPKVKRMVRDAVRWSPFTRKLQTINDVERILYEGGYQLWMVFNDGMTVGAVLTVVVQECQCKVLNIAYGAGEDVKSWAADLYEVMDDEATEQDCRFIRIEGREGWGKILEPLGFEEAYRAYMVEV